MCCGIKTAPNWKCFSPQGGLDPIGGQGSWPQDGAALVWPRTMHKSSTGKKKSEYHQRCWMLYIQMCLELNLILSVQITSHKWIYWQFHGIYLYMSFISLFSSPNLDTCFNFFKLYFCIVLKPFMIVIFWLKLKSEMRLTKRPYCEIKALTSWSTRRTSGRTPWQ